VSDENVVFGLHSCTMTSYTVFEFEDKGVNVVSSRWLSNDKKQCFWPKNLMNDRLCLFRIDVFEVADG